MENKTRKYFKYAIGEIVLVVIGILIALQINNWNESKKAREYELNILQELHTSLTSDYEYISNHSLIRNKNTMKAVHYFHDLIKGQDRTIDSLRFHFNWLNQGLFFQINSGPYESLKSVGVDKISNDSLRNQIAYYYDFKIPRISKLITWVQDNTDESLKLKNEIMGPFIAEIVDDKVRTLRPTPDKSVINDPKFLELLDRSEFRSNWTKNQYNELLKSLIPLKKQIRLELKK